MCFGGVLSLLMLFHKMPFSHVSRILPFLLLIERKEWKNCSVAGLAQRTSMNWQRSGWQQKWAVSNKVVLDTRTRALTMTAHSSNFELERRGRDRFLNFPSEKFPEVSFFLFGVAAQQVVAWVVEVNSHSSKKERRKERKKERMVVSKFWQLGTKS